MRACTICSPILPAVVLVALGLLASSGCARVPQEAIDRATRAQQGAKLAMKCAPGEYAAAQRMMDRMRELVALEKYTEAEDAAKTAEELFAKARQRAEAEREECLARLAGKRDEGGLKPAEFAEPLGPAGDEDYTLDMVFFDFNESNLTAAARETLAKHARWLNAHPEVRIQVSGHCDEQGSTEYNLALGERRAENVRKYLVSLGVGEERISIISYGEELPLDPGASESAYRSNRRAEFRQR